MRRLPIFGVVVSLAVGVVAIRYAVPSMALVSATLPVPGSFVVGGTKSPIITCTSSGSPIRLTRPKGSDPPVSGTASVSCTNWSHKDLSVTITPGGLSGPGGGGTWPTVQWLSTSFTVPSGQTVAGATLRATTDKSWKTGTFTQQYSVTAVPVGTAGGMGYSVTGRQIQIIVN